MPRSLVLLLLAPLVAIAAPVPKQTEKEKIEAKFGKVVDPKGDSTFALDGDALKITLPAGEERTFGYTGDDIAHPDRSKPKKFDIAPRVECTRTGDFTLTVRVKAPLNKDAQRPKGQTWVYAGGGVLLTPKAEGGGCRFGVQRIGEADPRDNLFILDSPRDWSNGLAGKELGKCKGEANWLRVTRKGESVTFDASADGKDWIILYECPNATPDETITVALYATHCSTKALTVTFDEFKIETPKPAKK